MYKTKVIAQRADTSAYCCIFNKKINEFLKENIGIKVIDIKFSSCCDDEYNFLYALIIYQEKSD